MSSTEEDHLLMKIRDLCIDDSKVTAKSI